MRLKGAQTGVDSIQSFLYMLQQVYWNYFILICLQILLVMILLRPPPPQKKLKSTGFSKFNRSIWRDGSRCKIKYPHLTILIHNRAWLSQLFTPVCLLWFGIVWVIVYMKLVRNTKIKTCRFSILYTMLNDPRFGRRPCPQALASAALALVSLSHSLARMTIHLYIYYNYVAKTCPSCFNYPYTYGLITNTYI